MTDKEQPEENPNVGKQFEEIMGKNFTPREESEIAGNAIGAHLFEGVEGIFGSIREGAQQAAKLRMGLIPDEMKKRDEEGELHVSYTSPKGWNHTWHGGPYITHHHPKTGPVSVTNVEKYDRQAGTSFIPTLTKDEFIDECHNWENEEGQSYEELDGKL